MLNNLSVGKKIGLMAISLIVLLVITASIAIVSMGSIGRELENIAHKDMPLIEKLTKITEYQLEQAIHFERAIHYGTVAMLREQELSSDYTSYTERFEKERKKFLEYGHKVNNELKHAQDKVSTIIEVSEAVSGFHLFAAHASEHNEFQMVSDQLRLIDQEHKNLEKHSLDTFAAISNKQLPLSEELAKQVEREEGQLITHVEGLLEEIEHFTLQASETALEHEKSALRLIVASLAIALVIAGLMSSAISKNITRRLTLSVEGMKKLANGDLTHRVDVEGKDEISDMLASQEATRLQLQKIISNITDACSQLSATSEQVATSMADGSGNIQTQQVQTDTLSASMQEMSSTSHEVARSISEVNLSVEKVDSELQFSNSMLRQTVDSILLLSKQLEHSVQTVQELDRSTVEISTVLQVISDIAEQTNLLALNAAIEAARAGEQGRGFSVVADEVRQLASRTQNSTSEITSIIKKLQLGSGRVVNVINETQGQAKLLVGGAQESSESLAAVAEQLSIINDLTTQIATAAEEQSSVSDDATQNVTFISDLGNQNAASIEETSQAGLDLARMAENLNLNVQTFKV